jgi:DNA polymerase-3 subunit alpha
VPAAEPWLAAERLRREYEAVGFFLSGHPLDDYAGALKRMQVQSWADFSRSVKNGVTAGRTAATVISRTERRTKTGNKMGIIGLSDPSGQYEAVIFSEGLQQFRELLEPGSAVLLYLGAEAQGDDVRARIQSVERLDQAAEKVQKGLLIHLHNATPLDSILKRLEPRGDGEITFILRLQDGSEADVRLAGRFKVSPQIAGAIKAVPGVLNVEAV